MALTDACFRRNIPCTVYATGCIYEVFISSHHSHSTTLSILWAAAKASLKKTSPTFLAASTVTPKQWPKRFPFSPLSSPPASKGVLERADPACAHAHLGRPLPAELHNKNQQIRESGEHSELDVGPVRSSSDQY